MAKQQPSQDSLVVAIRPPQAAPASSVETHHRVDVLYPCLDLIGKQNALLMFPPHAAAQRHEPKPLIKTPTAEAHSNYGSHGEWRHFSYTPATTEFQQSEKYELNSSPIEALSEHARLRRDMEWASSRVGETYLRCVTYLSTGRGKKEQPVKIRIQRITRFYLSGPNTATQDSVVFAATYCFPLSEFTAVSLSAGEDPEWVFNLVGLVHRKTDRAVKHVSEVMHRQRIVEADIVWKPERQLLLEQALRSYTKPTVTKTIDPGQQATEDAPTCAICCQELVATAPGAYTLLCNHAFCKTCIVQWLRETGPEDANCPLCRAAIYTQKGHVRQILHGLDNNYVFHPDPRYTRYENFERSCADLDLRLAKNVDDVSIFTDQPECITACFLRLIEGAALEDDSSAPHALQPCTFPETPLAMQGIRDGLQNLAKDPERKLDEAYHLLMDMAWKKLTQAMREGGLEVYLGDCSREDHEGEVVRKFLRPGLEKWLDRFISRALMMFTLRPCLDKAHWRGDKWHKHGGRDFFVPRDYESDQVPGRR